MATYTKAERLCGKVHIDSLFKTGQSFKFGSVKVLFKSIPPTNESPVKVVVIVPKRNFKKAHDRNRIKRLIKESWRQQKDDFYLSLIKQSRSLHLGFLFLGSRLPNYEEIDKRINGIISHIAQQSQSAAGTPPNRPN